MDLYIYSYNNYYNRIVKKAGNLIEDYKQYLHYGPVEGVYGFTPGDGVNTIQLIGSVIDMYDGKGNYLIAYNPELNKIDSRWFIIDVDRTRNGQWQLTLHRDLIVDYYDTIITSPMFIEKATLNADNPLIFNKEGITVNQIKTSEIQLKDETGCAWIVGYYDLSHTTSEGIVLDATIQEEQPYDIAISVPYDEWTGNDITTFKTGLKDVYFNAKANHLVCGYNAGEYIYQFASDQSYLNRTYTGNSYGNSGITITSEVIPSANQFRTYMNGASGRLLSTLGSNVGSVIGISTDTLSQYKNKTLRFPKPEGQTGYDYYKVTSTSSLKQIANRTITSSDGSLYTNLWNSGAANIPNSSREPNNTTFQFSCKYDETVYFFSKITVGTRVVKIPTTANKPIDAPYGLFCLPLPDNDKIFKMRYVDGININLIEMSRQSSLDIAMELSRKYSGSNAIYDIQLLPYCPILIDPDYEEEDLLYWNTDTAIPNSWTTITNESQQIVGIILHPSFTSFTKDINYSINVENVKLENECDMYRLVSPNYNGQFEFNAAKNGGVNKFNIDCTYMPYNPYIHLNPNFSQLYGQDFNDARGLVCGGDFSLPQMNDKWETYQINNKNYQAAFDREIQNMETQHDVARIQEKWAVAGGALSGMASGALSGASMGGIPGAVVGAVAGAGVSVLGGMQDIKLNEKLRGEALDYKNDMFGYQLENIKALPNSIMKTTAYTYNNKIYPILEYYTCTDVEKKAVANKIAWNGMTVMAIGVMNDYIGADWSYEDITSKGYIKGKLIRLNFIDENIETPHEEDIHSEDYHVVNAISGELDKGVYIK